MKCEMCGEPADYVLGGSDYQMYAVSQICDACYSNPDRQISKSTKKERAVFNTISLKEARLLYIKGKLTREEYQKIVDDNK